MKIFDTPYKNKTCILALGPESAGNFSIYSQGKIYYYHGYKNLFTNTNFKNFSNSIATILKKDKLRPDVILSDLHPDFSTTALAEKLAKNYKAKLFKIQHHLAHIFAVIGESEILNKNKIPKKFSGIACDGTGYGEDENIWGGEVFNFDLNKKSYKRIGNLENQILLGGELAILNPARMLISILSKFLEKEEVYKFVKMHFSKNEFELLHNQLNEKFNCFETSSTGRILDAVSVLLGFFNKTEATKHEAIAVLEKNSTKSSKLKPKIVYNSKEKFYNLDTTHLFKFLIKSIDKDKNKLAATAQMYLAEGLFLIAKRGNGKIYFGGGVANNKIMTTYLSTKNVKYNKVLMRGDGALSIGQIIYYIKILL